MKTQKIGILGTGKMGTAILQALFSTNQKSPPEKKKTFYFYERDEASKINILSKFKKLHPNTELICASSPEKLEESCDLIILAVKPQDLPIAVKKFQGNKCYVSIAAGLDIKKIASFISATPNQIARVMPNICILIEESLSAIYSTNQELQRITKELFLPLGGTIQLEKEEEFHIFTAISGSAPAFILYFFECLALAAENHNFSYEEASRVLQKVFVGTMNLSAKTKQSPQEIIKQVCSKGGTTEAGMEILRESSLASLIENCITATYKRSKELGT